ncbi:hypothetical protein [Variovorax paradoxus]|uniref:hypothetical protein n=1 Tax=Variovorax paradoxus TaxID=34073 RepID=UPI003393BFF2
MKLFEAFDAAGFHTSICTTFDIDFAAYESIALARMLKKRCTNNVLIADSGMLTLALEERKLPREAGTKYSVVGAVAPGVFHPKLVLQIGPKSGRLLVASANMTSAGLAGNLEVVGQVLLDSPDGPQAGLLRAAFDYLLGLLPEQASAAREQLQWARTRTHWLREATPLTTLADAAGIVTTQFLAFGEAPGIGSRFVDLVKTARVRRFVAVSPYWDDSLSALSWLNSELQPQEIALLIQKDAGLFPKDGLSSSLPVQLFSASPLVASRNKASRFIHAKVFVAQTDEADHVLFGSTNCTVSALGTRTNPGKNHEASLYRRLPPGGAVELLGLAAVLDPEQALTVESLPDYVKSEDLQLERCASRQSGSFELRGDTLSWYQPAGLDAAAVVELLDIRGFPLQGAHLTRLAGDDGQVAHFRLHSSVIPPFARVVLNDQALATSIVMSIDKLRRAQVSEHSRKAQSALEALENPQSLNEFNLLQLFTELDDIDRAAMGDGVSTARDGRPGSEPEDEGRQLTYEEFVASQESEQAQRSPFGESSLRESLSDTVRQVLNRILGLGGTQDRVIEELIEPTEQEVSKLFKRGDETADGGASVESGLDEEDEEAPPPPAVEVKSEVARVKRRQTAMKESQKEISKKIEDFLKSQKDTAGPTALGTSSLLKLRLLLQLVLATGSSSEDLISAQANTARRVSALLPCRGEGGWPALACRLLFEFFYQRRPAPYQPHIARLVMPVESNGALPVDIAETLLVCQWAILAVCSARDDQNNEVVPSTSALKLRTDVFLAADALMSLGSQAELRELAWSSLLKRYGETLGVSEDRITQAYQEAWRESPAVLPAAA